MTSNTRRPVDNIGKPVDDDDLPKANVSTELLFENRDGFLYASDDDVGSEPELDSSAFLTPSMSLAGMRLNSAKIAVAIESAVQTKPSEMVKPLDTSEAVTVLQAPVPGPPAVSFQNNNKLKDNSQRVSLCAAGKSKDP